MWFEFDIRLFRIAEQVVDDVMGPGSYEVLNGFSPRLGEMTANEGRRRKERQEKDGKAANTDSTGKHGV